MPASPTPPPADTPAADPAWAATPATSGPAASRPSRLLTAAVWSPAVILSAAMLTSEACALLGRPPDRGLTGLVTFGHVLVAAFWFWIGLAAAAAAFAAVALRRWLAAAVCLALACWGAGPALLTLANTVPAARIAASGPPDAPRRAELTVLSVNLFKGRADLAAVAKLASTIDADVIALQEITSANVAAFPLRFPDYPHRHVTPNRGVAGSATLSRLPIDGTPLDLARLDPGLPPWPMLRCTIDTARGPIAMYNLHPPAPIGRAAIAIQDRLMRAVAADLQSLHLPAVVAGDFNSPARGLPARRLRRVGCIDTHAATGLGIGATWPDLGRLRDIPLVRIDHVFVRPATTPEPARAAAPSPASDPMPPPGDRPFRLEPIASGVGPELGSDHRPVWATLRLVPARP